MHSMRKKGSLYFIKKIDHKDYKEYLKRDDENIVVYTSLLEKRIGREIPHHLLRRSNLIFRGSDDKWKRLHQIEKEEKKKESSGMSIKHKYSFFNDVKLLDGLIIVVKFKQTTGGVKVIKVNLQNIEGFTFKNLKFRQTII